MMMKCGHFIPWDNQHAPCKSCCKASKAWRNVPPTMTPECALQNFPFTLFMEVSGISLQTRLSVSVWKWCWGSVETSGTTIHYSGKSWLIKALNSDLIFRTLTPYSRNFRVTEETLCKSAWGEETSLSPWYVMGAPLTIIESFTCEMKYKDCETINVCFF